MSANDWVVRRLLLLLVVHVRLFLVLVEQVLLEEHLILPELGRLVIERAGDVRIGQQTLYGEQDGEHVVGGRPLLAQNVYTHTHTHTPKSLS